MSLREELLAGRRFQGEKGLSSPRNLQEAANSILHTEILPIFSNLYEQWKRHNLFVQYLLVDVNFSKEGSYTIWATPWLSQDSAKKKVVCYQTSYNKWDLWQEVERIAKNEWQLETGVAHGIGEYFLMPLG